MEDTGSRKKGKMATDNTSLLRFEVIEEEIQNILSNPTRNNSGGPSEILTSEVVFTNLQEILSSENLNLTGQNFH